MLEQYKPPVGEGKQERDYLSVGEFAGEMGFSSQTVYNLCARGELPHVRIGGSIRIYRRTLEAWLAAREIASIRGGE